MSTECALRKKLFYFRSRTVENKYSLPLLGNSIAHSNKIYSKGFFMERWELNKPGTPKS